MKNALRTRYRRPAGEGALPRLRGAACPAEDSAQVLFAWVQLRRQALRRRLGSAAGFTLVELVIAMAILGVLSFLLIFQFSTIGDKAMGATARLDSRSLLAVLAADQAYNLTAGDSVLTQQQLNVCMGLTDDGKDESGSKTMIVDDVDPNYVTYHYDRGGIRLTAVINVSTHAIVWKVSGIKDNRRIAALCVGLKIDPADLGLPPAGP